jgi:hypothetical protein
LAYVNGCQQKACSTPINTDASLPKFQLYIRLDGFFCQAN